MTRQLPEFTGQIAKGGVITAADILALRRSVWADGEIDSSEADAIFALNDLIKTPIPEWSEFFIEALSTWLVDQEHPRGYIDETQAAWLTERIERSGPSHSRDELELIVHCLERAESAPPSLAQFALSHVEQAVLSSGNRRPSLTARDVKLLRRLIFAPGSQHPGSVGQPEAEMLFRIKDATLGADNAPEWQELFVQGVGNYLQGFADPAPLSREREAELEDFINRPAPGIGNFFMRMAQARPAAIEQEVEKSTPVRWFGRKSTNISVGIGVGKVVNFSADKPMVFDPDAAKSKPRVLAPDQQGWLDRHIQSDQQIDPLERALLDFLKTA